MNCSSSQPIPLVFEPDSIYLVFIMRTGHPCAGVFHHNSNNRGILAYADVGIPGPRRSYRKVFSFELKKSKASWLPSRTPLALDSLLPLSRDRNRVRRRRYAQSGESSLPRMVTKRPLRFLSARRREPVDGKRLTGSRYEMGAEETGLDEPP